MGSFRKRPLVIEAVQLRWDTWSELCEFAGVGNLFDGKPEGCYVHEDGYGRKEDDGRGVIGLWIPTLEGLALATDGDWVIRGIQQELYACKSDIFEATYEAVTPVLW